MKISTKFAMYLYIWRLRILDFPKKIKRIIWHKYILLWWYRLWIRQDEFDKSLDMDHRAMLEMNDQERDKYLQDLCRRREIAHQRDLED